MQQKEKEKVTTPLKIGKQQPCVNISSSSSSSCSQVGHTTSQRSTFGPNQWLQAKFTTGQSHKRQGKKSKEEKSEVLAKSCKSERVFSLAEIMFDSERQNLFSILPFRKKKQSRFVCHCHTFSINFSSKPIPASPPRHFSPYSRATTQTHTNSSG